MPPAKLTRRELVKRLADAFRQYGYEGASMTRIALATGMGKASLYHHFPEGKAQMAQAVIDDTREWFEENIFIPLEDTHPPRQRLERMLQRLDGYYKGGRCAGMPLIVSVCEDCHLFADSIGSFYQRWIEVVTGVLVDAGLARDIAQKRAHDCVERIEGSLAVSRATSNMQVFARMAADMPEQILLSAARASQWTTRARFVAPPLTHRAALQAEQQAARA